MHKKLKNQKTSNDLLIYLLECLRGDCFLSSRKCAASTVFGEVGAKRIECLIRGQSSFSRVECGATGSPIAKGGFKDESRMRNGDAAVSSGLIPGTCCPNVIRSATANTRFYWQGRKQDELANRHNIQRALEGASFKRAEMATK